MKVAINQQKQGSNAWHLQEIRITEVDDLRVMARLSCLS